MKTLRLKKLSFFLLSLSLQNIAGQTPPITDVMKFYFLTTRGYEIFKVFEGKYKVHYLFIYLSVHVFIKECATI